LVSECEERIEAADAGYASVEALMAAVVLASALAFAQGAYIKASVAADLGLDLRRGRELAAYLMARPLTGIGTQTGQTTLFRWTLQLTETGQPGRIDVCRRAVRIESRKAATRTFALAGLEPCPPKVAA